MKIPLKYRVAMYRAFSLYVTNGQSITGDFIPRKVERMKAHGNVEGGKYYLEIGNRLDRNMSFSEALTGMVPEDELMMIIISERRNPAEVFQGLSQFSEQKTALSKTIFGQIAKFAIFSIISSIFSLILVYGVVPALSAAVDLTRLNDSQLFFIQVVNPFMQQWMWLFVVLFVFVIILLLASLPVLAGSSRNFLNKYSPIHSAYRDFTTATVLSGLSMLISAGSTGQDFFNILSKTGTPYVRYYSSLIYQRLIRGSYSFGDALDVGLLSPFEYEQLSDFSSASSDIGAAVEILGKDAIERASDRISQQFSTVTWGAMLLILGSSLFYFLYSGYLAVGTALTAFSSTNSF